MTFYFSWRVVSNGSITPAGQTTSGTHGYTGPLKPTPGVTVLLLLGVGSRGGGMCLLWRVFVGNIFNDAFDGWW